MLEYFYLYTLYSTILTLIFILTINRIRMLRIISFVFSVITFAVTSTLIWNTDFSTISLKPFEITLSNYLEISLIIGLDQCNIMFLLLTTVLFPIIILASWSTIKYDFKFFYALIILSEFFFN